MNQFHTDFVDTFVDTLKLTLKYLFLQNNAEFTHIHGNELGYILLLRCLLIFKNTCTPIVRILNDKESSILFTYVDQKLTLKYFCLLFMISCILILINSSLEYGESPHFELINGLYRLCTYIEMNFEISFLIVFCFHTFSWNTVKVCILSIWVKHADC